jgi:transcriptional regulator with XRE-family HTH domain
VAISRDRRPAALWPQTQAPARHQSPSVAVKARRQELGLTQEQLDNETDLHQRWLSNVETGKRNPSYASLRRLAAGLQLPVSELIARAERIESDMQASGAATDEPV